MTAPRSVRVFLFAMFLLAAASYLVTGIVLGLKGPYLNGADATVEDLFRALPPMKTAISSSAASSRIPTAA